MSASSEGRKPAQTDKRDVYIRFRLSNLDVVQSDEPVTPWHFVHTSPFYAPEPLRSVPVIRIYGATDKGQRVVAHAHGCFPYLYASYDGPLDPDSMHGYIRQLGKALNRAVSLSFKRESKQTPQFIAHIVPCKGVPIYGFHVGYRTFLKIYVTSPRHKKRVGMALRSGAVMRTVFEVFEEHIPYPLQFMLDHNLYGCGWVELSKCHFRLPLPAHQPKETDDYDPPSASGPFISRVYNDYTVDDEHLSQGELDKISRCSLELDFHVADVVNRDSLPERPLHDDFREFLQPETVEKGRLVNSVRELWDDERRRRTERGEPGPKEVEDTEPREWDSRDPEAPIWKTERSNRLKIQKRVEEDLARFRALPGNANRTPSFETYAYDLQRSMGVAVGWLNSIRTTFQQVDALYEERMTEDERTLYVYGTWSINGIGFDWSQSHRPIIQRDDSVDLDQHLWEHVERQNQGQDARGLDENDDGVQKRPKEQRQQQQPNRARVDSIQPAIPDQVPENSEEERDDFLEEMLRNQDHDEADLHDAAQLPIAGQPASDGINGAESPEAQRQTASLSPEVARAALPDRASSRQASESTASVPGTSAFTSPEKRANVHFASNSNQYEHYEEPCSPILSFTPPPSSPGPAALRGSLSSPSPASPSVRQETESQVIRALEDLSQGDLEDFEPTPTLVEPGPESVPEHLRSDRFTFDRDPDDVLMEEDSPQPEATLDIRSQLSVPSISPSVIEGSPVKLATSQTSASQVSDDHGPAADIQLISMEEEKASGQISSTLESVGLGQSSRTASSGVRSLTDTYVLAEAPPTFQELYETLERPLQKPHVVYPDPHYSNPKDRPDHDFVFGGRRFRLQATDLESLREFEHWGEREQVKYYNVPRSQPTVAPTRFWTLASIPPSRKETLEWLTRGAERDAEAKQQRFDKGSKQVAGPTQVAQKFNVQNVKGANVATEKQHLSVLALELAMLTRDDLLPDPKLDCIVAIFYCLQSENDDIEYNGRENDRLVGVIAVDDPSCRRQDLNSVVGKTSYHIDVVASEEDMIDLFVEKVRFWDPEIFAGYEVHKASWGFLLERMNHAFDRNGVHELGRVGEKDTGKHGGKVSDRWGYQTTSTLGFSGRHVIPIWRTIKADNKLLQYSFEHVAFHVLHRRVPHYSTRTITGWLQSEVPHKLAQILAYHVDRVEMDVEMLEATEIISQNSEAARVFGVDFNSVRTRGSQFKVEAVMFRIAKPESLLMPSPTREEVGEQNAAECQPLIQEPQSAFYKAPLAVLDFQSLYPSVMIAYNFCYSTCLGRVDLFKGSWKLGTRSLELPPGLLWLLKDEIIVTPNGIMFVKARVRKSLLAKMLTELLDTRVMVKEGMKAITDKGLTKLLNARQLALKFLANVTYGYTSATFSGRMPCVEIADSIVATGRETLEAAREQIHAQLDWGAEVVYGDTDSLFVYLPGKTKDEGFTVGRRMAADVSTRNPRPVKLKFEKIYLPCVLLAKKRYVGNKYEKETDEAEIDAKGIETIRRDGIVATQRIQERCLKILFRTADLSQVKAYVLSEFTKIMAGDYSPQDFTYAKEVKPGSYAEGRAPPPGMMVAARRQMRDPRAEAEWGERVAYILFVESGRKQVDRALSPLAFVDAMPQLQIDVDHYIEKAIIPPLDRIFNLLGADVKSWYDCMPKTKRLLFRHEARHAHERLVLENHFGSTACPVCGEQKSTTEIVCSDCQARPDGSIFSLSTRSKQNIQREMAMQKICASCSQTPLLDEIKCDSIDCPVFYSRMAIVKQNNVTGEPDLIRRIATP